ncbi:MAG: cytochrome d ubiquinol oxidase subunit II [Betaproteobacteria bacterium]
MLDLPLVFMGLMGFAILAYVILDGFDLGVGILVPFATPEEQDLMVASIGPFWDANETWLVLGVGILLVAFPRAHGIILSALYLPVAVMLFGIIVRGVGFELRFKATGWHRDLWNHLFCAGSLVTAIAQGVMLGGVITGFDRGWVFMLFRALVGLGLAGGYALLGATWLLMKTEGDLQKRALRFSKYALVLAAAGVVVISLATPFASAGVMDKWFSWPKILWLSPLPLLTVAAFIGIWRSLNKLQRRASDREWLPFVLAVWIFVFSFAGLAYSMFPYLVIDRVTIWQAAAARESLRFVFIGVCIVLPLVFGYTLLSYRVFWGKAKALTYGA